MTLSAFCYALGYLTGMAAFAWMAKRRGFRSAAIWTVMQAGLIGGLLGANAAQSLLGGAAGKTVLGGIVGGWLAVAMVKRYCGLRRPTGDLFAVALCAGEAVGRLGCFFGGCCYGKACDMPWRVWQHGAFRHPTQLYLALSCAVILLVLIRIERGYPAENRLFNAQGLLYCGARFAVEAFRVTGTGIAGLSTAQWACLGGMAFFGFRQLTMTARESVVPPVIGPVVEENA